MRNTAAVCQPLHFLDNGVCVDPMMFVEIADCSGLTEVFDTKRNRLMRSHTAEPSQRGRVAINRGNDLAGQGQQFRLGSGRAA